MTRGLGKIFSTLLEECQSILALKIGECQKRRKISLFNG